MAIHVHVHYTHVYVLMCAVNVYTCKHMCMVYALRVCMYVCTHVCVHACTVFACMCVYVCVPYECTHACAWKLPVSWPLLDLHSNRLWTQTIRYLKGATSVTASPHAPPIRSAGLRPVSCTQRVNLQRLPCVDSATKSETEEAETRKALRRSPLSRTLCTRLLWVIS